MRWIFVPPPVEYEVGEEVEVRLPTGRRILLFWIERTEWESAEVNQIGKIGNPISVKVREAIYGLDYSLLIRKKQ